MQNKPLPPEGKNSDKLEAKSALYDAACSGSSISGDGLIDVCRLVKTVRLQECPDQKRGIANMLHRIRVSLAKCLPIKPDSRHEKSAAGSGVRSHANKVNQMGVHRLDLQILGRVDERRLPKGFREYLADGGVMSRYLKKSVSAVIDKILGKRRSGIWIGEKIGVCPSKHCGKVEMWRKVCEVLENSYPNRFYSWRVADGYPTADPPSGICQKSLI